MCQFYAISQPDQLKLPLPDITVLYRCAVTTVTSVHVYTVFLCHYYDLLEFLSHLVDNLVVVVLIIIAKHEPLTAFQEAAGSDDTLRLLPS